MRSLVLGLLVGVAWLQVQAQLPPWPMLGALAAAAALCAALAWRSASAGRRAALFFACGAAAGFAWAAVVAHDRLATELPPAAEGKDLVVTGTIESLPYRFERGVRFDFAVGQASYADGGAVALPPRLALSWYAAAPGEEGAEMVEPAPGERWRLTVRLKRPHGNANPYGFDYEVWLLEQGLRATGSVRADAAAGANRRLDAFVPGFSHGVERCRAWLRERIFAALPEHRYAGVVAALVIGDQRAISQADWKVFNRTGIGHLVSISGLHITMIAGLFAALVSALWRRSFFTGARLPLRLPAQKAAAAAAALAAWAYVLLAGFGVPAQRTFYMLAVVAVALWCGRIASVSHVLCAALAAVLILDPWAVLWPGFWLSFGAVALILYAAAGRTGPPVEEGKRSFALPPALRSALRTQYVVTLGLVPLSMLLFGQVSLISPVANALAIPLISFGVTPVALAGSVLPAPLSGWLLQLAHALVAGLAQALEWMSGFDFAVWSAPVPPWWGFALAAAGTLWMLAPRGWPARWLGAIAWMPLLFNAPARPENGVWLTAFDVGQGNALLVETAHHRLLYDTGPFYSPESDGGSRVILPYLKARGIAGLDAVVVSHNDNDHSGGALSIFDQLQVGEVLSSLAFDSAVARRAPNHRRCMAGQAWNWDGVAFEILHPAADSYDNAALKSNARSCTLKVSVGARSILLAGDIEAAQEAALLQTSRGALRASVLLAPHHGSGTSSTAAFLQAVAPELALFQVGYRNRYRHPKPEVFERYGAMGIRRLRSDEAGAVTVALDDTLAVSEYRREHARYWYGR